MSLIFHRMREDDLDAVYKIEVESFSHPWLREFFEMEMQHDSYVAEKDNEVAGYICAMQVMDECTITNIAVRSQLRRQGIAKFMLEKLFQMLDTKNVRFYYLEVRASNQAAQDLYDKIGFTQVGIRKDYYHHPTEDAIVMTLDRMQSGNI